MITFFFYQQFLCVHNSVLFGFVYSNNDAPILEVSFFHRRPSELHVLVQDVSDYKQKQVLGYTF